MVKGIALTHFLPVLFAGLVACTSFQGISSGGPTREGSGPDELFDSLVAAVDSSRYDDAVKLARELINTAPAFKEIDVVFFMGAKAAYSSGELADAVRFSTALIDKHPESRFSDRAALIAARSYFLLGKYYKSMELLAGLLVSSADEERAAEALELERRAVLRLSPGEMEELLKKYPTAPAAADISFNLAMREYARGDYEKSYELLAELLYRFPRHERIREVRRLLKLSSERMKSPRAAGFVDPFKIGILYPMTGRFSMQGRLFRLGVELALEDLGASGPGPVPVVVEADSRGSPLGAVKGVRKLIREEGVVAVLGGVLTVPTLTAAVEANAWGVPMLCPVVNDPSLGEIGDWIVQTRVPEEVELYALAGLSTEEMLLQRFSVLAPDNEDGRRLAGFFAREIEARGAEVVSIVYFEPGDTDFREQLETIRESSPEALFIPARPEELILILPQIRFYDLQVQLLGTSEWNSERLLRVSKSELEGALFPLESYHGEDRETYRRFLEIHSEKIGGDPDPLTVAGYFGARVLFGAIASGSSGREQVRDLLLDELYGSAEKRMKEAEALTILTVRNGVVREFEPAASSR